MSTIFTGSQPHLMALYNRWMNERMYAACATLTDAQRREDLVDEEHHRQGARRHADHQFYAADAVL